MKWLALVLAVGCSKSEKAPAAAPKPTVEVLVDGKPLAIDRAFLRRASPDVFSVVLGAGKGSCTEDGTLGFTIAKRVAATGHERFWITDVYSRDFDAKAAVPVTAELDGTKLTVAVTGAKLAIRGTFDAVRCPDVHPTGMGVPKVTHKSTGTITVAGKKLEVKGVTVQTRVGVAATDLPNIVISTNLKDCSTVTLPAPVILERVDGKWSMRGTWFADELRETEATSLAFNANAVGKTVDGPSLELQLMGTGKLGDYSVKLEGLAEAIECVR